MLDVYIYDLLQRLWHTSLSLAHLVLLCSCLGNFSKAILAPSRVCYVFVMLIGDLLWHVSCPWRLAMTCVLSLEVCYGLYLVLGGSLWLLSCSWRLAILVSCHWWLAILLPCTLKVLVVLCWDATKIWFVVYGLCITWSCISPLAYGFWQGTW